MDTQFVLPRDTLVHAAAALKSIAADKCCRAAFRTYPLLRELFAPAASRYIVATDRAQLLQRIPLIQRKGYRIGIEYVGEEAEDPAEILAIVDEYLQLIAALPQVSTEAMQIGFDLSNVGLLVSTDLAIHNTRRILNAAVASNITVVLSMERSTFVDSILDIFMTLAPDYENLGITLQAYLHRTIGDLGNLLKTGRKIRLVKGVYNASEQIALPRGASLDERYLELLSMIANRGAGRFACATHDRALIDRLHRMGLLSPLGELEMLYGVNPELAYAYKVKALPCRISMVYGSNWFLHFLHRLAEFPPNILTALADLQRSDATAFGESY